MIKAGTFSVSIDVEDLVSPDCPTNLYFGKLKEGDFGVTKIMEICEQKKVKAIFFVDVLNALKNVPDELIRDACQEIHRRGHEVALHTHPPLGGEFKTEIWFTSPTGYMSDYSEEGQYRWIMEGSKKIQQWIGVEPKVHRAGSYGANLATLKALTRAQIKVDSSLFWGVKNYETLDEHFGKRITPFQVGEVLEIPITSYRLSMNLGVRNVSMNKKLDITWSAPKEVKSILALGLPHVDLFLHSYSLIQSDGWNRPNHYFIERLKDSLDLLNESRTNISMTQVRPADMAMQQPVIACGPFDQSISDFKNIYWSKFTFSKLARVLSGKKGSKGMVG